MPRSYDDFVLDISHSSESGYTLRVVRSSAGECTIPYEFPFDSAALQVRLKDLQIALLRSGGARRSVLLPEEATVQEFGATLYDSIFVGEVRSLLETSRRTAVNAGQGLRLRLRFQSAEMAALPWEYLFDKRLGDFVALAADMPIVRHLPIIAAAEPLIVQPPLRVLGMIAAPANLPPIDVRAEQATVAQALRKLTAQGLVELEWVEGQSWRALRQRMREEPWHVVHFMGHGSFDATKREGVLYFTDDVGQADALTATEFNRILAGNQALRLVLLNACLGAGSDVQDIFASTAATLVRGGVPAVIAMQYEITDAAATEFARTFYEALVDGLPVDAAVDEARRAISVSVSNSLEWGIPVLFMRSSDGHIFDLDARVVRASTRGPETVTSNEVPSPVADARSVLPASSETHQALPQASQVETKAVGAPLDNRRMNSRLWWEIGIATVLLLAAGLWYAIDRNRTATFRPPTSNALSTLAVQSDKVESGAAAVTPAPVSLAPGVATERQFGWNVGLDSKSVTSVMLEGDDPSACAVACRESTTCVAWWLEMNARGSPAQCHLAVEVGNPIPDRIGTISGMSVAILPHWNWNYRHTGAILAAVIVADPMQCQSLCDENAQCAAWDYRKPVCGSIAVPACNLYAGEDLTYDTCFVAGFADRDE